MPSILDLSEKDIQKYLELTGQTRQELEDELNAVEKHISPDKGFDGLKGVNPDLKDKFNGDPGFEIIDRIQSETPKPTK